MPDDIRSMKWWGWGDEGTEFQIDNRPDLWPYIRASLNLPDDRPHSPRVAFDSVRVPEQKINRAFLDEVTERLGSSRVRDDKSERLTHAFGKSFRDLWRMRHGAVNYAPDCVLYPETSEEVSALVASAVRHQVGVIPFGGGTNIAGCLEPIGSRDRMTVSVDMRRMNRLLKLDGESETARFQAGVLGPDIEEQLNRSGFTLGHFPDSFRYSTLGGWVATRSAGMQSDRYGKIEDIVLSLKMVTPAGLIETLAVPRASSGIDINRLCIGSEGVFGIITEVVLNVHRMPERKETLGYLFPDFQSGLRALHRCHREGCVPAMARLNDPKKTALSFAFKTAQGAAQRQIGRLVKSYLKHIRRMKLDQACLMLVSFEGSREVFERDRRRAGAIFRQLGAFGLGAAPGRAFQAGKFDFPHLRDFLWDRGVLTDVSETATVWSNILPVYQAVTQLHRSGHRGPLPRGLGRLPYQPYLSRGRFPVFHLRAGPQPGRRPGAIFACEEGGGGRIPGERSDPLSSPCRRLRAPPMAGKEISPTGLKAIQSLKRGLDPCDLFNSGKFQSGYGFTEWGLPDDGDKPR